MAALMKQRSIMVFTHDSIGLGEDGPTHQPVEHVAGLRIMPNMHVWRPCDDVESLVAWQMAVERHNGPSALILSRQNLAHQARDDETTKEIRKGGYVLSADANPQVVLVSTGSEVQLAMSSAEKLREQGVAVQVVSMPCVELFLQQTRAHRDRVLPRNVPVVAIEAGVSDTWYRFVGPHGKIIGLDTFGESAPAGVLYKHFGFTVVISCLIVSRVQIMQTSSPCLRVCIYGMGLIQKKHCFAFLQQQIAGSVTTRVAPIAAMKFH